MALAAILAKLVIMGIFVTAGTISVLDPAELLEFLPFCSIDFMTFDTFNFPVLSGKLKFSVIMIEF